MKFNLYLIFLFPDSGTTDKVGNAGKGTVTVVRECQDF